MSRTLFEAAAKGDQMLLERALNSEFGSLDLTDINQALLRAAQNGNAECVSRLLAEGADIDCDDCDGDTPLMLAAANNHTKVVKLLIYCGCDIDLQSDRYRSALHMAVWNRCRECMFMLLEAGCDVNLRERYGDTPLMLAARRGYTEAVRVLLDHDQCDVNVRSQEKDTALHYAADNGHAECVRLLLARRPDLDVRTLWGYTPLMFAAMAGHADCTRLLLDAGADFTLPERGLKTTLHFCADRNLADALRYCLMRGASPDVRDSDGNTALHHAVVNRHGRAAKLLIQHGADVHLVGRNTVNRKFAFFTCLEIALYHRSVDIAALLLAAGARLTYNENAHPDLDIPHDVIKSLAYDWNVPPSLQTLCRNALRMHFNTSFPDLLKAFPVPKAVKSFLMFDEFPF